MTSMYYCFLSLFCGIIALGIGTGNISSIIIASIGLIFSGTALFKYKGENEK